MWENTPMSGIMRKESHSTENGRGIAVANTITMAIGGGKRKHTRLGLSK